MKVHRDFLQGSDDWWTARRGRPTASAFDRILTPAEGKPSGAQTGYLCELVAECAQLNPKFFTERGILRTKYTTPEQQHGLDVEDEARQAFADRFGEAVETVGFCESDCGRYGGSPDGLVVGRPRGVEIKCPQPATHFGYVMAGVLPREYKCQVHGHLIVSGFQEWDFWSYLPGDVPPFHVRVVRDDFTVKLAQELERFLAKLEAAKLLLLGKAGVA